MTYTLGTAAKAAGVSKATIHRAVKSGLISASRKEGGNYEIQPVELHRVFPPVSRNGALDDDVRQSETPQETWGVSAAMELAIAKARLEAEIEGLKELLRAHREQVADLRGERDRLLSQVEATHRLLTHHSGGEKVHRRWWWPRAA